MKLEEEIAQYLRQKDPTFAREVLDRTAREVVEEARSRVTAGVADPAVHVDRDAVKVYGCLDCGQQWLAFRNLRAPKFCPGCGCEIERVTN